MDTNQIYYTIGQYLSKFFNHPHCHSLTRLMPRGPVSACTTMNAGVHNNAQQLEGLLESLDVVIVHIILDNVENETAKT